ncbi:hypothetical protein V474_13730 [Novosphingobium barchaimii LL02]|uniref:Uncharacterized protein n=1 Tax=Novosphingobium barchaimii LL02 TaxID=1114963 RepID=A0A0J8AQB9_9SPHN|nr:hypothetical protein [Novosphingobium barchaimii]KMS56610.1 hypothetical protein V474_13730 [Novosphingobium barchaimii LL02]
MTIRACLDQHIGGLDYRAGLRAEPGDLLLEDQAVAAHQEVLAQFIAAGARAHRQPRAKIDLVGEVDDPEIVPVELAGIA